MRVRIRDFDREFLKVFKIERKFSANPCKIIRNITFVELGFIKL